MIHYHLTQYIRVILSNLVNLQVKLNLSVNPPISAVMNAFTAD